MVQTYVADRQKFGTNNQRISHTTAHREGKRIETIHAAREQCRTGSVEERLAVRLAEGGYSWEDIQARYAIGAKLAQRLVLGREL
jgi:hypothetical protein